MSASSLLFSPPLSTFDPSFWEEFYRRKLNVYGLSSDAVSLSALAQPATARQPNATHFSSSSFDDNPLKNSGTVPGVLLHFNTIEAFGRCDKKALLKERGLLLLEDMLSGEAVRCPEKLQQFVLLCFADLKTFKFVFWFASPVLTFCRPPAVTQRESLSVWDRDVQRCVLAHAAQSRQNVFAVTITDSPVCISLAEAWETRHDTARTHIVCAWSAQHDTRALCWKARNLLSLLALHSQEEREISLIVLRNNALKEGLSASDDVATQLDELVLADESSRLVVQLSVNCVVGDASDDIDLREKVQFVGWEPNERGKPSPRLADLSVSMSPTLLAAQAVDLNLHLMKWRLWPSLRTERLAALRVLLLGSGTLGCSVARCLLGWGVRDLTFVDNGRVSLSNPVRQSLFEHADAQQRTYKAIAAARAVQRIFPGVRAQSAVLSIPMPGHPYTSDTHAQTHTPPHGEPVVLTDEAARAELHSLIAQHDVVFVLTDSREARWLPTAQCALLDKPLVNVALGFDSFLAMRHHCSLAQTDTHRAGCYFCSDVVAATNSQRERPLDQQCTVTRPGLSAIAAGLAVELTVALFQRHWQREEQEPQESEMVVPHQLRGSVWGFTQMSLETSAFPQCTACSSSVVTAYAEDPSAFTKAVCAEPQLLERVSGVQALLRDIDTDIDLVDIEDDGDF